MLPAEAARRGSWGTAFLCLLLATTLALGACGKKGPPQPPGPADKIIYPRAYPAK